MDATDALENRIEQLRESGIGFGLSDKEIDHCILGLLNEIHKPSAEEIDKGQKPTRNQKSGKSPAEITRKPVRKRRCCRIFCFCVLALITLIMSVLAVISNCGACEQWLERSMEPFIYPITKNWRLLTLPLARRVDLHGWYGEMCLINNPLAAPDTPPCHECRKVTKEHELYDATPRQFDNNYKGKAQPLIIRELHPVVTFDHLKPWYEDNIKTFDSIKGKIIKAPKGLTRISQILANVTADEVLSDPDFHVEWLSDGVNPSRMLRKLFPRQKFISKKAEVNLLKTLLVLGPEAPSFRMEQDSRAMPTNWYVQASGSRRIKLTPHKDCSPMCPDIDVVLDPGDILCYTNMFWNIESSPVTENRDITVAFLGSFE